MDILNVSLDDFPDLFIKSTEIVVDEVNLLPSEKREYEAEKSSDVYYDPNDLYYGLNSLRHKYVSLDETKSFRYINRILSKYFMDEYMLSILSDWQLGEDSNAAIHSYLTYAERYPQFFHVWCSCLIQAAQIFAEHGNKEQAQQLFKALLDTEGIETNGYLRWMKHLSKTRPDAGLFAAQENPFQNNFFNLTPALTQYVSASLQKHGLAPSEALLKRIRPCIKFSPTSEKPDIGDSHLGGVPDVPSGWEWPRKLEFLAQFNLEDLAPYDASGLLPKRGLLHFFASYDWSKRNYRVDYYDGDLTIFQPASAPSTFDFMDSYLKVDGSLYIYPSVSVRPFNTISLPTYYTCYDEEDEKEGVAEAIDLLEHHQKGGWRHQMFGHHSFTESNALIDVWERETGRNYYDLNDAGRKAIESELDEWILLFQMDSCQEVGTMFPDRGIYYFMIRKDDLAALRFDNVYVSIWGN